MTKYTIKQKKEKYVEITVEAKSDKKAQEMVDDGDYNPETDVLEDEFLLPSSDWETIEIRKANEE